MGAKTFKQQFLGEWRVEQRILDLENRLTDYYNRTMFCSDAKALQEWREFKNWCGGVYTQSEINNAKHNVQRRLNI